MVEMMLQSTALWFKSIFYPKKNKKSLGNFPESTIRLKAKVKKVSYNNNEFSCLTSLLGNFEIYSFDKVKINTVNFIFVIIKKEKLFKVKMCADLKNVLEERIYLKLGTLGENVFSSSIEAKNYIKTKISNLKTSKGKPLEVIYPLDFDQRSEFCQGESIVKDLVQLFKLNNIKERFLDKIEIWKKDILIGGHRIILIYFKNSEGSQSEILKLHLILDNVAEEEHNSFGIRTNGNFIIQVKLIHNFKLEDYILELWKVYNNYRIEQDWIYCLNLIVFQYLTNYFTLLETNCQNFSKIIFEFAYLWEDYRDIMNNFYVKWI